MLFSSWGWGQCLEIFCDPAGLIYIFYILLLSQVTGPLFDLNFIVSYSLLTPHSPTAALF